MKYRNATHQEVPVLATMNEALIRDEGHRNRMTLPELEVRLSGWLAGDYRAVVFEDGERVVGYALFRNEPEYLYLRQLFVRPEFRRRGVARGAIAWLCRQVRSDSLRLRIDVLVGNSGAIAFWRALGFWDYCLTMEWEPSAAEISMP